MMTHTGNRVFSHVGSRTVVLPQVLMRHQDDGFRLTRCPISGGKLHPTDRIGNLVYMLFQMNSGMGKNLQGGFRTAAQVWLAQVWIAVAACCHGSAAFS